MRTKDFKRDVVSILLVLGLVFSMISVAPLASPGELISDPGGTTIEVAAGDNFLIRHVLEWNEAQDGAYGITIAWDCYDNEPSQNFTFVENSAYFISGPYAGESILAEVTWLVVASPDYPGSTRYILSVRCPANKKDPRNGQFNVDITLSASGVGGVPHIPGDHVIPSQAAGIIIIEASMKSWNRDPITIRVLAKLISISPNYQSGLPGTTLEYTVTVTNLGENEDSFDLTVSDSEDWGPTLDDYTFENIPPGENMQTTLRVTIPENAVPYNDIITVTATSQETQISDNASCIAYVLEIIIEGKNTAYNLEYTGPPPWVWYDNNPPILAAGRVGDGAIVAGGTICTCRNARWNLGEWDIFLDSAFQWMVSGATNVLWYEGYYVYNNTTQCSDLVEVLESLGYSVTGDATEPITSSLLLPYDILVIPQLQLGDSFTGGDPSLLPDADVDAIVDFVEAGGGLLIMEGTDYFGYNFNRVHNKILQAFGFGLIFQSDSVYDDVNNQGGAYEPWCDVDTTTWIGSAYENETGENEIGFYSLSSLAPPPPAGFAPPHSDYGLDTDNDDLYNYLVVEVNVSVDNAGWYRVDGSLHDSEWNWITYAWADNYLDVGTHMLELRFNGWHINSSGRDGPYRVYMELYDDEWNRIDSNQHETAFYTHDQFQPPPARFAPPHSDYGLDTDNDNLYNYLVVEVNVSVDNAGWYRVHGGLEDSEWNWITGTWVDNYLDVGAQTLELRFEGLEIYRSERDGPYYVYLDLYDDEWNCIDINQHETAFYTHDQFQGLPARFAPPHSDYGLDTDNDNLYNYLVIEVDVSVNNAGWYRVYGGLHDSEWNWITGAWADNYLDVGAQTLELCFDGMMIHQSGRDGPYRVYLDLYSWEYDWLGSDEHGTKAYTHDQFQPSGFILEWLLVGPFSPNGYYVTYTDFLGGEADVAPMAGDVVGSMTWFEHHDSDAYIDFNSLFSPNDDVCAYAFAYVHSPSARQAQLRVGSDDGVMVWLNGVRVLDSQVNRGAAPDQDIVSVMLDGGWNRLLVKVGEWYIEWGFYLRFTDAAGRPITDLTIALEPPPLIWDALIAASFTHGSDDAIFGVRPDATYGFDSEYDIPEAPAPVAPPYVRTFFYYPEQTPDELHRSCLGPENLIEWPLRVEYTEGLEEITLTWDLEDVPDDYFILLYRGENLVADMRAEDNYTFEASTGSYDFRIIVGTAMPFTLELTRGWNMISFPVLSENMSPDSIFDGYYVLYRWDAEDKRYVLHADSGSFIEPDPDVEVGVGYWVHVLKDENVTLLGDPVTQLTLNLRQDWNLLGPPYGGSSIADPADDPDDSVIAWAFTWDAEDKSYRMTQQLEAGKGYWINTLRDCTLELP